MKKLTVWVRILGWIVSVLLPLVVLMLSVRLLITPVFAKIEYRTPGFPEDPFGFVLEDRLRWSQPAIKYLVNAEQISYLYELTFETGEPIFNQQELSHMEDVKDVVTGMRIALAGALLVVLVLSVFMIRNGFREQLISAFSRGGWLLIGLIAAIILFVALNFNDLFTWFHKLFFESGTWQFYTSDTLIRLFPMRFWRDAFLFVGGISIVFGGVLIWFGKEQKYQDRG